MAAHNDLSLSTTPHPCHPDYIWPVDSNQGPKVRYPFGDPALNGIEVALAYEKEVAIAHEKKLPLAPRSSTAWSRIKHAWSQVCQLVRADRRGPFFGLTRRLFLILVVTALVIAGIVVLVVKLVSERAKSSLRAISIPSSISANCTRSQTLGLMPVSTYQSLQIS